MLITSRNVWKTAHWIWACFLSRWMSPDMSLFVYRSKRNGGILTREDSLLGSLETIRSENLVGRPPMVASRDIVVNELANWFEDSMERLDISVRYNLLYNVAMLVKHGFGDALCIRLDCSYPGLRFVPLQPPLVLGSVLVWKKHQVTSPAVGALIMHARQCLKSIPDHSR